MQYSSAALIIRCCRLRQDMDDEVGEMALTKSRYVVAELPVRMPVVRPAVDKPNPKLGIGEWPPVMVQGGQGPWAGLLSFLRCSHAGHIVALRGACLGVA